MSTSARQQQQQQQRRRQQQQEEDEKIKQREKSARSHTTHVQNLASKINVMDGPSFTSTPSSLEPGGIVSSSASKSPFTTSVGVIYSNSNNNNHNNNHKTTLASTRELQQMEDAMMKQRGRRGGTSTRIGAHSQSRSVSPVPGATAVAGGGGGGNDVKSTRRAIQQMEDSMMKQRGRGAGVGAGAGGGRGAQSRSVSPVPDLAQKMGDNDKDKVTRRAIQEMEDSMMKQRGRGVGGAANRRPVSPVPSLAQKMAGGDNHQSISPLQAAAKTVSQEEKDMLLKQREREARGLFSTTATRVVPNLASKLSIHEESEHGPPAATASASATVPNKMTQVEKDLLIKQKARETMGLFSTPATRVVPNLASKLSFHDELEHGPASGVAAAVAVANNNKPSEKMTQEEKDLILKRREREERGLVSTTATRVVPNLNSKISMGDDSEHLPVGETSSASDNILPQGNQHSTLQTQRDLEAKLKGQSYRNRPSFGMKSLSPKRPGNSPTRSPRHHSPNSKMRIHPPPQAQEEVAHGAFACDSDHVERLGKTILPLHPKLSLEPIHNNNRNDKSSEDLTPSKEILEKRETVLKDAPSDIPTGEKPDESRDIESNHTDIEKQTGDTTSRKKWIWIAVAVLILATGGAVGTILAGGSPEPDPPAPEPTTPPPSMVLESDEVIAARSILLASTISSADAFEDISSPQSLALTWVAEQDQLSTIPTNGMAQSESKFLTRYVLAVFYFSLGGPRWATSLGWLDGNTDECEWERISCASNGVVRSIMEANDAGFVGTIPSELQHLSGLETLSIVNNKVSGIAGSLGSLRTLDLGRNQISGSFPEGLYETTSLVFLNLERNRLTGTLTEDLGNLSNLNFLYLRYNKLDGTLADQFNNLENLRQLSLAFNDFAGDMNQFIEGKTELRLLDLISNRFTGTLGEEIAQLTNLMELQLSTNELAGTFPNFLANFTNLRVLDLGDNRFTGTIASAFGSLTSLQDLKLGRNGLSGPIPSEIGMIGDALEILDLSFNGFVGSLPSEIGNLQGLVRFTLETNFIEGSLPTELGRLQNLDSLTLNSNLFTGAVPTELGQLTKLVLLGLAINSFTGLLPYEICEIPNLQSVRVTLTELTCTCPTMCTT